MPEVRHHKLSIAAARTAQATRAEEFTQRGEFKRQRVSGTTYESRSTQRVRGESLTSKERPAQISVVRFYVTRAAPPRDRGEGMRSVRQRGRQERERPFKSSVNAVFIPATGTACASNNGCKKEVSSARAEDYS